MKIKPKHIIKRLIQNSLKTGEEEKWAGIVEICAKTFVKNTVLVARLFPIDVLRKNSALCRNLNADYYPEGEGLIEWSLDGDSIYDSQDWKEAEQEIIAEYMEEMEAAQAALQSVVEKYTSK